MKRQKNNRYLHQDKQHKWWPCAIRINGSAFAYFKQKCLSISQLCTVPLMVLNPNAYCIHLLVYVRTDA